jgi:hypothetical protein
MTRCLVWVAVASLVFAGAVSASVRQGDTELEFMGGYMTENASGTSGMDTDAWFVSGALGYFVTDNLQLVGSAFGYWTEFDSVAPGTRTDRDIDVLGLGGKARWHFMPGNQWVPYIGAQLFYADADTDVTTKTTGEPTTKETLNPDGVLWGPLAGMRFEMNATNDLFLEYQYHVWDGDIGKLFEDGHAIFVGIVHQFK